MTDTLTTASTLSCPHGGTVTITSSNLTTTAAGSPIVRSSDTFTVAGCSFMLPGPKPSPCLSVRWIVADLRVTVGGVATLSQTSTGICLSAESVPQGPVTVSNTQRVVSTQ